ncbi:MAG: aminopeptidase [Gaiellaceae bacterium]
MADTKLDEAAATTVERLGVGSDESLLVLYNDELAPIAEAIATAGRARAGNVRALSFPTLTRNGEEPPDDVAAALLAADAVAIVTTYSLSHTVARLEATRKGARVASMPGITVEMFARTLPIDYAELESVGRRLAAQLTDAERCRIVAPAGTDVELVLRGRTGLSDDGDLRAPGAFGNLPAGEAYIAPFEREGKGTIVFDLSVASSGLLEEPLHIEFADGRAVAASGGAAAATLLSVLDSGGPNGRVVAELGIGTNPAATITGKILEDEKVEGTIHIAFGTNTGIGGENQAAVHIDGVVRDPTVELDGRTIMRDGRLVA